MRFTDQNSIYHSESAAFAVDVNRLSEIIQINLPLDLLLLIGIIILRIILGLIIG